MHPNLTHRIQTTLLGAAIALLASTTIGTTAARAQRPLEPIATHQTLASVIDYVDIRDTPAKEAFELLLEAGNAQYALRDDIDGTARIKASGRTVNECLASLRADSPQILISSVDDGIYFLRPDYALDRVVYHPRATALRAVPHAAIAIRPPSTLAAVHRRVTGVVIVHGGPSYALLETDSLSTKGPDIRVVSWGPNNIRKEPMLVPSGLGMVDDLTVSKIDATGVTLTAGDGSTVHVALASAAYGAR